MRVTFYCQTYLALSIDLDPWILSVYIVHVMLDQHHIASHMERSLSIRIAAKITISMQVLKICTL